MAETERDDREVDAETLDQLLEALKCSICLEVIEEPFRVRDCGHMFCRECIEKNLKAAIKSA